MPKEMSLIEGGAIDPSRWRPDPVKQEVATILQIEPELIESIDYWLQQISVKIVGQRCRFVSYRSLSLWLEDALAVIKNCRDVVWFERLGAMLRYEMKYHSKHYPPASLTKLERAWKKKMPLFKTRQSRLLLQLARQQEGLQWQQRSLELLSTCRDLDGLNRKYQQVSKEGEEFADLVEVIYEVDRFFHQRWIELSQTDDPHFRQMGNEEQ